VWFQFGTFKYIFPLFKTTSSFSRNLSKRKLVGTPPDITTAPASDSILSLSGAVSASRRRGRDVSAAYISVMEHLGSALPADSAHVFFLSKSVKNTVTITPPENSFNDRR
jgi:hypothetical protein